MFKLEWRMVRGNRLGRWKYSWLNLPSYFTGTHPLHVIQFALRNVLKSEDNGTWLSTANSNALPIQQIYQHFMLFNIDFYQTQVTLLFRGKLLPILFSPIFDLIDAFLSLLKWCNEYFTSLQLKLRL